jgi:hypothetical protein
MVLRDAEGVEATSNRRRRPPRFSCRSEDLCAFVAEGSNLKIGEGKQ